MPGRKNCLDPQQQMIPQGAKVIPIVCVQCIRGVAAQEIAAEV
jgi:hypothetical protein